MNKDWLAADREAKKTERSNAAKILRRFANRIRERGFRRKSTFFARQAEHLIQFLHIHKYSFGPCFRMHVCIRVLNSPRPDIVLIGMASDIDGEDLEFEDSEESVEACATALERCVIEIAEPWFEQQTIDDLLAERSFLPIEDRKALKEAILNGPNNTNVQRSRELLGTT